MSWFNFIGCIIVAIIMVPNIVYAVKSKGGSNNTYNNKIAVIFEQVGRYGCMAFMIFNVPYTYFNFWFCNALLTYIIVNSVLCVAYLISWFVFWKTLNTFGALSLSILPSCVFLFSGVILASIPLLIASIIFATCHILISYKNTK